MQRYALILAVMATTALAAETRGQGLLDQQLGPVPAAAPAKPAAAGDPAKPDAPKTDAKPDAPPPGGEITNPDAVKKVDDDELMNQLLQPNAKPDPDAVKQRLKDMVVRMADTTARLTEKKDPGEVTQETQRRIVGDLDVLIELARQQQQQSSGSSQPQPGQQRQPGQPGPKGEGGSTAATSDPLPRGSYTDAATGDMHNRDPANWGGLPPRDRDQVSHGANEEYLTTYKDLIDRYYQALAEMGKTRNR